MDLESPCRTECGRSCLRWISVATSRSTNTSWWRAAGPRSPLADPPRAAWRRPSTPDCPGTTNPATRQARWRRESREQPMRQDRPIDHDRHTRIVPPARRDASPAITHQRGTRSERRRPAQAAASITSVETAGRAFGISRRRAYELVYKGTFSCEVSKVGGERVGYKVVNADLHRVLGIRQTAEQAPGGIAPARVDHVPSPSSSPSRLSQLRRDNRATPSERSRQFTVIDHAPRERVRVPSGSTRACAP